MTHTQGTGARDVHQFAWKCFLEATEIARIEGNYGAGQDLLVDAPSGNVRGAGPGVAEIEFERDNKSDHRPAESFLVFAGDKCAPGAYNLPLYLAFCDPMHNGGLLLSPRLHMGFTLTVIDRTTRARWRWRRIIRPMYRRGLGCRRAPSEHGPFRHRGHPLAPAEEQVAVAATRLHNIAGRYTGKDDP
jgi:fructose 1,6-bisphosphate aldolase/phosphatase